MRAVLKGKTQEFIQGGITPSGLATQVRRGIIKGFDATTYRATVQLLGSLSVWLEGVPVAKHIGNNLLASGTRCGVLFFDESNPGDACVAFVYDGAPGPWITSGLVVDGAITASDCLSNVAGGVATIDASSDLNPPNHVRAAGRFYPGGQGTRYLYDAGATSGLAVAGGPFSATGRIYPGTGSALQTTGYLTADAAGNLALMGGNVGIGSASAPLAKLHVWDNAMVGPGGYGSADSILYINSPENASGNRYGYVEVRINNSATDRWRFGAFDHSNGTRLWRIYRHNTPVATVDGNGYFYPGNQTTAYLGASGTDLVMMGGNVGIGAIAPLGKLHVNTAADSSNAITIRQTGAEQFGWSFRIDANGDFNLYREHSSVPLTAVTVLGSGNVGIGTTNPSAFKLQVSGDIGSTGYIYPGTGSALQSSRYIRDDGDRLLAYGGFKIDVASGDTPLVFQRAGAFKWTNYVYSGYDDLRWAAYIGASWYDRMVLDDGSGNLYIDGTYNTFSPVPPKENMSPEDYLAWAMEDASKPPKPYSGIPKEPAELEKYRKDISRIAIGVARYVDHLRTQVAALEAKLTQAGF